MVNIEFYLVVNIKVLTNAMHAANIETVPLRWRE